MSQIVYIELKKSAKIYGNTVKMTDVAELYCEEKMIEAKAKAIKLLSDTEPGKYYIIKVMHLIKIIESKFNEKWQAVEVNSIGETKCLVEIGDNKKMPDSQGFYKFKEFIKCSVVCLLLFFGAGFSIMAFDNDISLEELFDDITNYFAGGDEMAKEILAFSYAIGIFIGIIVFYNHFNHKKFSKDPTPIEVQMKLYEDDVVTTLADKTEG